MANLHTTFVPLCPVCNKPVDLRTCKTDGDGKAVHDECYFFRLHLAPPPRHLS